MVVVVIVLVAVIAIILSRRGEGRRDKDYLGDDSIDAERGNVDETEPLIWSKSWSSSLGPRSIPRLDPNPNNKLQIRFPKAVNEQPSKVSYIIEDYVGKMIVRPT